jgi:hypothetical protein
MRATLVSFAGLVAASFCAASWPQPPSERRIASVCELAEHAADFDGRRVRVRAQWVVYAHGVTLEDHRCPKVMLFPRMTEGGPNLSLCSYPDLEERFGCPAGTRPHRRLIGTFSGLYVVPEVGAPRLYVEAMGDFLEEPEDAASR